MSESQDSASNDSLLSAVQSLVIACTGYNATEQRKSAERLDNIWSSGTNPSLVYKYYGSKTRFSETDTLKKFLRAIEGCNDDLSHILLCRIADGIINYGGTKVSLKRHRLLIKADAVSSLIRALRSRFKESVLNRECKPDRAERSTLSDVADDAIASLILVLGAKDARLTLKIRVGGLLTSLCNLLNSDEYSLLSPTLLKLLCRSLRSPRNGQLAGRHRGLPNQLLTRISIFDQNDPHQLLLLARHLEILYFISRNRKTRILLISEGIVACVLSVVERHLEWCKIESQGKDIVTLHLEVCHVSLALLRLLANIKKAKADLVSRGTVALCERAMRELGLKKNEEESVVKQLQDSLCVLCLRCLPTVRFPLASVPFPLRMALPKTASPARRRYGSVSKSPIKRRSVGANITGGESPTVSKSRPFDDGQVSSDDGLDEDDDLFCALDGESEFSTLDGEMVQSEGEDDVTSPKKVYSVLKLTELTQYDSLFSECIHGAKVIEEVQAVTYHQILQENIQTTKSVTSFVKIAYPELADPDIDQERWSLAFNRNSMKDMVVQEMARTRMRVPFATRIVFDVDSSVIDDRPLPSVVPPQILTCEDTVKVGKTDLCQDHLLFESRFESGNLRRATQVGPTHYELILSPDINQMKEHYQWFYFEVSNIKSNIQYTFEIINCLKTASMFSNGMQPVMYSVCEALAGRKGWVRAGEEVCYYRNLYTATEESDNEEERGRKRHFYSIRFKITFQNKGDICYFAYHYPYTYSYLKATLSKCLSRLTHSVYYRKDVLGTSLGGNTVNLLTITAPGSSSDIHKRDTILLTARVHPGESNSSWMMHGIIDFLLTSSEATAEELRAQFVFKVVPMLNPDGVVNGSHRCSLAGIDLNRVWDRPNQILHPEIYLTKSIVQYMVDVLKQPPFLFVDLHGHSRRSNVFLFGNNPEESWRAEDRTMKHNYEFMTLPEILEEKSPAFSFKNCRFSVTRDKESSARVAVWRQFGIRRAYTLEATYCGFETGQYQGYQIGTYDLKKMGQHLIESILEVRKLSDERSPKKTIHHNSRPRRARSSSSGEANTG